MTLRAFLPRALLVAMSALQLVLLAGFLAVILAQQGAPDLASLLRQSLGRTETLAVVLAVAAAMLPGTIAAMALWRTRRSGMSAALILSPLLLPMALFSFGDDPRGHALFLLAHAGLGLGLGTLCGMACLAWLDLGVLRAAACSGVSPWGAMRRVVLPVMAPGILAASLLSAIMPVAMALLRSGLDLRALSLATPSQPVIVLMAAAGLAVILAAFLWAVLALLRRP